MIGGGGVLALIIFYSLLFRTRDLCKTMVLLVKLSIDKTVSIEFRRNGLKGTKLILAKDKLTKNSYKNQQRNPFKSLTL